MLFPDRQRETVCAMPKITKRSVDALEPREREHVLWDDEIKGFGVRIHPTGGKVYVAQARGPNGQKRVTVGRHPLIGAEQARQRAALIISLMAIHARRLSHPSQPPPYRCSLGRSSTRRRGFRPDRPPFAARGSAAGIQSQRPGCAHCANSPATTRARREPWPFPRLGRSCGRGADLRSQLRRPDGRPDP